MSTATYDKNKSSLGCRATCLIRSARHSSFLKNCLSEIAPWLCKYDIKLVVLSERATKADYKATLEYCEEFNAILIATNTSEELLFSEIQGAIAAAGRRDILIYIEDDVSLAQAAFLELLQFTSECNTPLIAQPLIKTINGRIFSAGEFLINEARQVASPLAMTLPQPTISTGLIVTQLPSMRCWMANSKAIEIILDSKIKQQELILSLADCIFGSQVSLDRTIVSYCLPSAEAFINCRRDAICRPQLLNCSQEFSARWENQIGPYSGLSLDSAFVTESESETGTFTSAVFWLGNLSKELEPIQELEYDEMSGSWQSSGNDPAFLLNLNKLNLVLRPGCYKIEIGISRTNEKPTLGKLYFDMGDGFTEAHSLGVSYCSEAALNFRTFRTKKNITSIRFDPTQDVGDFVLNYFKINKIADSEEQSNYINEITLRDPSFSGMDVVEVERLLLLEAEKTNRPLSNVVASRHEEIFILRPGAVAYSDWIKNQESSSLPSKDEIQELMNRSFPPLISLVMPTYNTDEFFLRRCIESVIAQSYGHWELCIADDCSPNQIVRDVLQEYSEKDRRIKVMFREKNGHISNASNSALSLAVGTYIALLDHDDEIPEHALFFVAKAINDNPSVKIIYSDEDKISETGVRFDPNFKPDWNEDLFLSQNYISHLGVYEAKMVREVGGFRVGYEGSQDYDLALRCIALTSREDIVHIPRVLYHWRTVQGSTALGHGQKSYTTSAGVKALQDYIKSTRIAADVEDGLLPNTYRVRWKSSTEPLVSILIPTRDRRSLTEVAVRSILEKTEYQNFEIIIIDNGSVEAETLEFFECIQREDGRVRVLRYDYPFNYSAINNFGREYSKGEIIALVNNDVEVISACWLTEMVSLSMRVKTGCVGAKLYYSNDTVQHAGIILGIGGVAGHSHKQFGRSSDGYFSRLKVVQNVSAVTAACLLIRAEIYDEVGGLDEENLRVAFNDVDFCLKVLDAGYENVWTPYAELYHYESISRGSEDTPEKALRFQEEVRYMQRRWKHRLKLDPHYSPNLTQDHEDFSIA